MSDLAEKPKVNLDLWDLFIIISLFSFHKLNYSKIFPFKCIRQQIGPWYQVGQSQPMRIILNKHGGTYILNATYHAQR